ncbi:MAG TPA: MFS transporter [Acidimicrobiales bacterium]|nr:MFS transporter [Acidimicrobiales bacterium]
MSPASLRPLRSRNFALLWSAALVSNVGSWMQAVALGILVTARTHNALWTGLVAAAAFLPNGLLAPFGGALADRLDRRRWLMATTLAEAACATVLAVLSAVGDAPPAVAVLVAFLGGSAAAVGLPAYQAMLPDLVADRDDLLAAVALSSAQYNLGRVVGPALAGIVLALGSYALAFACNAVSFVAVVVALLLVRLPAVVPAAEPVHIVRRIAEGARLAFAEPGCRAAILLIGVVALLASPFIALVPAMAIQGLHLGSGHRGSVGTSVLVTAQGIGAVAAALMLPGLAKRFGRRRQVVAALFVLPVLLVLYGVAPALWLSAALFLLVGFAYMGVLSGLNTVVQLRAPADARGRVLSLFMLSLGTVYPVGAVVQGAVGAHIGVREVTVAGAALLAAVLLVVVVRRPAAFGAL